MLAADLRFAKSDIWEANNRLMACQEEARLLARSLNMPIDELLQIPEWDFGAWHETLNSWMTAAFTNRVMLPALDTAAHLRAWRGFLIGHLRGGSSIFCPNLNDLLLRSADLAMPFPSDWNEVACLDCAKALRMTQIDAEPLLRETILVELGFAQQVAGMLPTVNVPPDALELLEICLSAPVQRTGDRVLLVIGGAAEQRRESSDGDAVILVEEAAGSVAAGWRLSAQHAVLPLFAPQVVETTALNGIFPKLNLTWILHEPSLPPLPGMTVRGIFRVATAGSPTSPDAIVGPASLDAAVDEMRKRSSRASVA